MLSRCEKSFLGIRKPRVENQESLSRFLLKNEIDTSAAFFLSDSLYISLISSDSKFFSKYEVYDFQFKKIVPKDTLTNQCYGSIELILQNINDQSLWEYDTLNQIQSLEDNMKQISGGKLSHPIFSSQKYYVIFYWAKFMGKYTESLLDIASDLEKLNKTNVEIVTINMDKNVVMADSIKNLDFNIQ